MRKLIAALVASAALASSANAVVFTLTFEGTAAPGVNPTGFGNGIDAPQNYYNGGNTLGGLGPGPAWGIQFVSQSLTLLDADSAPAGQANGNFANEPTGETILFFLGDPGSAAVMNVPAGFDTGFATYYSSIAQPGQIRVWSGLNATGAVLATIPMVPLGTNPGGGDPTGDYNIWQLVGANFPGIAMSVSFEGAPNFIGFDDVTFGSNIPEPTSLSLLALGGLALAFRRR